MLGVRRKLQMSPMTASEDSAVGSETVRSSRELNLFCRSPRATARESAIVSGTVTAV